MKVRVYSQKIDLLNNKKAEQSIWRETLFQNICLLFLLRINKCICCFKKYLKGKITLTLMQCNLVAGNGGQFEQELVSEAGSDKRFFDTSDTGLDKVESFDSKPQTETIANPRKLDTDSDNDVRRTLIGGKFTHIMDSFIEQC